MWRSNNRAKGVQARSPAPLLTCGHRAPAPEEYSSGRSRRQGLYPARTRVVIASPPEEADRSSYKPSQGFWTQAPLRLGV